MDKEKISQFIKERRKKQGLTQEELAEKLFVTEKAISRWETGRGTPDISLLIPLSNALKVSVSELLNGKTNVKENISDVINYVEMNKKNKFTFKFVLACICYLISMLVFLGYLRIDYNTTIEFNYFYRLIMIIISSIFLIIGSYIISVHYIDKVDDKIKFKNLSLSILFIYYAILLFNMSFFSRTTETTSYNLIPFKTILDVINTKKSYNIIINLLGNFLVFMPINYALIELFKVKKTLPNFTISIIIVLLTEIIQLIFSLGVFDIDDIILCTTGMITFYFLYTKLVKKEKNV